MIESVREGIIGRSPQIEAVRRFIREAGAHDAPGLLLGEPGVGKEIVARCIHAGSLRAAEPFLMIDCSLYYERELEREIFGFRAPGSGSRRGVLEFTSKGTCYLSRVEELTIEIQRKILAFIQAGCFERLGDGREIGSGARILMSSDKNLSGFVAGGLFDAELYAVLEPTMIRIAPLRERSRDVEDVVRSMIAEHSERFGAAPSFTSESLEALCAYPWPRNFDELEKEVRRLLEAGVECARIENLSFEISSFWRGQCEDPDVRRVVEELDGYIREFRVLSRLDAEFGEVLDDVIEWGNIGGGRRRKERAEGE